MPPDANADAPAQEQQRRYALLLEYDGGSYSGSQLQENAPTIQAMVEIAIKSVTRESVRVAFAGRTDAGTHALGQMVSFLTTSHLSTDVLHRALNARLPSDVAVQAVAEVDLSFDVRRDATRRHYRYSVTMGNVRPALGRDHTWYVGGRLDTQAMARAAARVVGKRDFAAFSGRLDDPDASTVRDLERFEIRAKGGRVSFHLVSNAFLPHQVRRMVGALVDVGLGKRSVEQYVAILDGAPASAGPAAPARGLCLVKVDYEEPPFGDKPAWEPAEKIGGLDSNVYVC